MVVVGVGLGVVGVDVGAVVGGAVGLGEAGGEGAAVGRGGVRRTQCLISGDRGRVLLCRHRCLNRRRLAHADRCPTMTVENPAQNLSPCDAACWEDFPLAVKAGLEDEPRLSARTIAAKLTKIFVRAEEGLPNNNLR